MFLAALLFLVVSISGSPPFMPILKNWTLNDPLELTVNKSNEYIIHYDIDGEGNHPLRVVVNSTDAKEEFPLLVVVRQKREVVSWELPLNVDDNNGRTSFMSTGRTLCYDRTKTNEPLQGTFSIPLKGGMFDESPVVSITTSSLTNTSVSVVVESEENFYVEPNKPYTITVTPSLTRFYFYDFPNNASSEDNMETVVLEVTSDDNICMIISIQNASCPVYDLKSNIKFEGYYETMIQKGGITVSKAEFPLGFFVVFVPKTDDYDCTGSGTKVQLDRNKTITYIIKPSIGHQEYLNAVLITIACIGLFYITFGISFFVCSTRIYIPRTMEYMADTADTPSTIHSDPDFMDRISYDETEYDTIAEETFDREAILNKPVVYLSDLARKDFRILKKKSYSYLWHVLTVALFYGLPVIQLVLTYQKVLNDTGNQDLCYYNFLCAHPYGFFSDFNHIFSNIGYIMFGILFLWIVYRRERWHQDNSFDQQYGIPQHYGLFYAMGIALIMEGVLSASYHICPNHSNFQFDTSFMYVMAVLSMVKIYQTRHPDINATAYSTFGVLAIAILLGMIGILDGSLYFWIGFTILHIITGLYLTVNIYYMGCWTLNRATLKSIFNNITHTLWISPLSVIIPRYKNRFVLLLIGNICNWSLAVGGLYNHDKDFAMYLLGIFMVNTMLYFIFYITMKLLHKEKINMLAFLFLVLSLTCASLAMYCFLNKSISWALPPAQSRQFNQECKLMHFYDFHDIWHFLSAVGMFFMFMVLLLLDDDLSHTHRTKIPVF